ncbi:NADH-quinone oxidoreductase subunit M [Larsenimonas suaedae]|uniref:NADH-quinone oxidoreductase subunit M n=1 Tax=Larsenimonas suaedae TaxID=1851019 RepID=A0ABU1GYD2_9GAMM|nr:NADH-quinone oxidoreductase subunit M [Larsenimonas suaedae]MCM2973577.1 NADH-quinone oxidoreductase subunit M [Larsenimonas suaedae]MDR5897053.1 NADH-quinone oxidoreductase subunit M [Larsenimonas suaedae]
MILLWLILIPFIGGLLCWQTERFGIKPPRVIALVTMLLELAIAIVLWWHGDYGLADTIGDTPNWVLEYQLPWIERFGISFHLGLDGLSLIMILLTGFLGVLAVTCSWAEIDRRVGFFHLNLLWIIGAVVGIFLAIDLFLFFFFWEMMLVPMYFLIALWGHSGSKGNSRVGAAMKFFIYTQASGLLMLVAILGLVFAHFLQAGVFTFDYSVLRTTTLSEPVAMLLMLGFFIAFAVKLPVVPLHGWLPDAHAQAPTAGSVDLAGILLKTAAYGMLRFMMPMFPDAAMQFAPVAMALGLIGIFYGAVMAFSQTDVKRLIACSSISHMGFVLIGIFSNTLISLQGVVALMVAHAFSSAGLFIVSGQLYERLGTRDMREMGGLFGKVGALPGFAMVFVMASLGMPGTANFIGEFLILFGAFEVVPWVVVVASIGLVLAAVYSLILMQRIYFGPAKIDRAYSGLDTREFLMLLTLFVLTIALGFFPQLVLDVSEHAMTEVVTWVSAATNSSTL